MSSVFEKVNEFFGIRPKDKKKKKNKGLADKLRDKSRKKLKELGE